MLEKITRKFIHSDDMNSDLCFKTIHSFMYNNVLISQGTALNTEEYKYVFMIHKYISVKKVDQNDHVLTRIGRNNDGGYLVVKNKNDDTFSEKRIAYSLGISDDVSLDLDLASFGYEVYQYDHTIDKLPVDNDRFHWSKIGISGKRETATLKTLSTLIKNNGHQDTHGMYLKSDIEGAEWSMIIYTPENVLKQFDQITLEFHNLLDTERRNVRLEALKKLYKTHQAVHVHGNNYSYAHFNNNLITPDVLEVTYLLRDKYSFSDSDIIYPISLDQPCNNKGEEILLGRWNV